MRWITELGPGKGMAVVLGLLFFAVNARLATRVAALMVLALFLRELLALALQSPRPYWVEPGLRAVADGVLRRASYGLPSGHAMVGTAVWMYLGLETRRRWAWMVGLGISLAICVSRVWLGVHFFSDVLAGFILGLILLIWFRAFEARLAAAWSHLSPAHRALASVGAGLSMIAAGWIVRTTIATNPIPPEWTDVAGYARRLTAFGSLGGAVAGLGIGLVMMGGWAAADGPIGLRLLRLAIVGAIVYCGLRPLGSLLTTVLGPKPHEAARVASEFCLNGFRAWCGAFVLPWFFIRFHLSRFDRLTPTANVAPVLPGTPSQTADPTAPGVAP